MPTSSPADIQVKLNRSREELLDLSLRNPLINYRYLKARGVEAMEASPEQIFPLLVTSNRKFSFAATSANGIDNTQDEAPHQIEEVSPEYDAEVIRNFDDLFRKIDGAKNETLPDSERAQSAIVDELAAIIESAETVDSRPKNARDAATTLQTVCPPAELHRRLLGTMQTARTFIEEQGVNTLFLALGMLQWREAGTVSSPLGPLHRAPLILVPVELERSSASDRFTLRYTEDDITGNDSLAAYLKQQFNIELPPVPDRDDMDVDRYLGQVALKVSGKNGWSVDDGAVALAFFSFNKYLMYKELDDAAWPEECGPSHHPILTSLLGGGFAEAAPRFSEDDYLDRALPPTETKTVVEADGSQVLAIEDVKQGRNLVIQGPPGTGKSQSITNIIAEALGQNKSVLFVSEKMAALEVVKRRLDSVGLGDACLELHSNKTNKKNVLAELKRTLGLGKPVESQSASDDISLLSDARDRLNTYCDAVNAPVGKSGWTPHALYGEWLRLQSAYSGVELPLITLPASHTEWASLDYRQREQLLSELQAHIASMGAPPVAHPYWGSVKETYVSTDADIFRKAFADAHESTATIQSTSEKLAQKLSLPTPTYAREAEALAAAAQRAIAAPEHDGMQFSSGQWLARRTDLAELIRLGTHLSDLKKQHGADLTPEAWDTDVQETRLAVSEHGAKWYKFLIGDWRKAQKALRLLCASVPPKDSARQLELLDAITDYRRTKTPFIEQAALGATLFGAQWQGERSNWPVLSQLLQWIVGVHEEIGDGRLPKAFVDFLSGASDLKALTADVTAVQTAHTAYRQHVQHAVQLLEFREEIKFGTGYQLIEQTLAEQNALLGQWATQVGRLQQITVFNYLAARCHALELGDAVAVAARDERGATLLVPAFQRSYYQALLRQVFSQTPALSQFNGAVHGQTAAQFRRLDSRLLEHNRVHLALQHWQAVSKLNSLMGQGGDGQIRVLSREFEKKSRHLPIRQLMEKAGNAVQAVKPVFMMSPLSVATFLPPAALKFDLIVFDEASQVKPVDALGALARGGQAVVVGDSKQLPPTSFFDSIAQADGAANEDNDTADMESVLGLFVGQGAPQRMLRWHYRSRHESLIAVSNKEFYDNKLVIFPSPDAARAKLGLVYRHLPETVYDRGGSGTNRAEAKAVAEAALAHARIQLAKPIHDWQTLGIAAFSMGQMQAILDQMEILRRSNPDAEAFFNAAPKNEPFFVKNLENVQGDERDLIFISVGYGRDKNGQVSMNFGPLNKQGGERRLNVLISRARLRCEVFTNLLPDDIDTNRTSARGVESFKNFLIYARLTAGAASASDHSQEPTAPFEREVLAVLQAKGHQIVPQVGCAGYFVDLAIVDSKHPGRYILGIECDGPNYQSARSSRDRDRLRAEVLGAMGWRLHRIWSTDWIHRYDDEVQKLLAVVEEARLATETDETDSESAGDEPQLDAALPSAIEGTSDATNPLMRTAVSASTLAPTLPPPYQVAAIVPNSSIDINNYSQYGIIADMVTTIVQTESPVHWHEISRRIAAAIGVQRVTDGFHGKVATAASFAEHQKRVQKRGMFYWLPQMQEAPLRNRAALDGRQRSFMVIADEEIEQAVKHAVSNSYGMVLDDVARSTCRLLGFEKVTIEIKDRVDSLVSSLLIKGALVMQGDALTIGRS